VDPHAPEVHPEARLHERPRRGIQRLPRRAQRRVHAGRCLTTRGLPFTLALHTLASQPLLSTGRARGVTATPTGAGALHRSSTGSGEVDRAGCSVGHAQHLLGHRVGLVL
jgi:hypothetical protein